MWNKCGCQPYYSQVSPAYDYCGPSYVSPAYDRGKCGRYNGNMFVLLVVLFILLIIVGSCSKW